MTSGESSTTSTSSSTGGSSAGSSGSSSVDAPFERIPTGVMADLNDIAVAPNGEVWVAGDNGTVLRQQNGSWIQESLGASDDCLDVLFVNANVVVICQDQIHHRPLDSGTWISTEVGSRYFLSSGVVHAGTIYVLDKYDGVFRVDTSQATWPMVLNWRTTLLEHLRESNGTLFAIASYEGHQFNPATQEWQVLVGAPSDGPEDIAAVGGELWYLTRRDLFRRSANGMWEQAAAFEGSSSDYWVAMKAVSPTELWMMRYDTLSNWDGHRLQHVELGDFRGNEIAVTDTHVLVAGDKGVVIKVPRF